MNNGLGENEFGKRKGAINFFFFYLVNQESEWGEGSRERFMEEVLCVINDSELER